MSSNIIYHIQFMQKTLVFFVIQQAQYSDGPQTNLDEDCQMGDTIPKKLVFEDSPQVHNPSPDTEIKLIIGNGLLVDFY